MGLHPSLKRGQKLGANRSVMKRTERIKWLIEKGKWNEKDKVLGLPKIKIVKLKALKKEKAKETEGDEATAEATNANAAAAKASTNKKEAAPKSPGKKKGA